MSVLVLDSGAISRLAERSKRAAALIKVYESDGLWPPVVPSPVLIECLQGHAGRDAVTNRFLRSCDIHEWISEAVARRAAFLRTRSRHGSAVDALLVAMAEPGGTVLTTDPDDLNALAAVAASVLIERI